VRLDVRVHVKAARQLFLGSQAKPLEHFGIAGIRSGVAGQPERRGGQRCHPGVVVLGSLVRERPTGPDLLQQLSVLQARPRLGLYLLQLEFGTQSHLVVVENGCVLAVGNTRVVRSVVGGHPATGQQGISQCQRFTARRINDQEFFLDAECSHTHILRQGRVF
jgi:hypothetical protein